MATIFAANESQVKVAGKPVEGVRALDYRRVQLRENVFGLGTNERIGMVSGGQLIEAQLRVASTAPTIDVLGVADSVQIIAELVHAGQQMTVTFDECFLTEKTFEIGAGGHGEAVYAFTATRMREAMEAPAAT